MIYLFLFLLLNLPFFEDNKGGRICTVECMLPYVADAAYAWLLTCLSCPLCSFQQPDVVLFVVPGTERAIVKL